MKLKNNRSENRFLSEFSRIDKEAKKLTYEDKILKKTRKYQKKTSTKKKWGKTTLSKQSNESWLDAINYTIINFLFANLNSQFRKLLFQFRNTFFGSHGFPLSVYPYCAVEARLFKRNPDKYGDAILNSGISPNPAHIVQFVRLLLTLPPLFTPFSPCVFVP